MSEMVEQLRNIAFVAHGGAGKASLAEVMLYNAGGKEQGDEGFHNPVRGVATGCRRGA
ncbi:MAG: hypothetical protein KKC23_02955 [Proteobacteria bacterium]|nr:hypothetical protein [Pseudomonadota bacterium]